MPLPRAQARKLIHTRIIDCRGYERDDGLWDIEGHLTDAKTYTWNDRGDQGNLAAGEFAHDMWLRLTIDVDMVIHEAVAATDAGPFSPCGDITPKIAQLKGKRISRGWTKELRELIGGPNGCTHHWELLGRIATTAYQSTHRVRHEGERRSRKPGQHPYNFNTCHMYTPESRETLRHWPDLYTGPKPKSLEQQS